MLKAFDLKTIKSYSYEERDKNVFYKAKEFKMRIIELPAGGVMPECKMLSYVIFYVISGNAEVKVNKEQVKVKEGQCFVVEPATPVTCTPISMKTDKGVLMIGIQIPTEGKNV